MQAWSYATVLRQDLSVCNERASSMSSGRARPSASGSDWARGYGEAQARARNAGTLVLGPHATRALGARGAWRGGRIRSTKEYQHTRRHIAPRNENLISPTLWPLGKGLYSPHDAVYVSLSSGLACQNSRVANNAACAPGRTAALHTRPARRAVSNVHGYAHCTRGRHRAGTPHEGTMPLAGPGGEPCRLRHERHGGCRDQRTMNRVSVHIAINNGRT